MKDSNFMTELKDFEIVSEKSISKTYSYLAAILLSKTKILYIKLVIYGNEEYVHYIDIIENRQIELLKSLFFMKIQSYKNFALNNLKIIKRNISEMSPLSIDFNATLTILIGTNLHTFLYEIYLDSITINITLLTVFRKFYSCQNAETSRPLLFENFLGMFCERNIEGDEFSIKSYSYFLLYKFGKHILEVSPILALPFYYEIYDLTFYKSGTGKTMLIIPCFLSLFTEYELRDQIEIEIKSNEDLSDFKGSLELSGYNDFTESNLLISFDMRKPASENSYRLLIILLGVCAFVLLVLATFFGIKFLRKMKSEAKKRTMESITQEENFKKKGFVKIDKNYLVFVKNSGKKKSKKAFFRVSNCSEISTTINTSKKDLIFKDNF